MWEKIKRWVKGHEQAPKSILWWLGRSACMVIGGAVSTLIAGRNVYVGSSIFGMFSKNVQEPTWRVLAKIGLFALGTILYYWAWEVFFFACLWFGIKTGGEVHSLLASCIEFDGWWRGSLKAVWFSIPLWLEPLFWRQIKQFVVGRVRTHAPATGSVRRWFTREYRSPDHNPYPEDYAAHKRPLKGRQRPKKRDLDEWHGRNTPLNIEAYEVGRRYVVDYAVEDHKASTHHWDLSFRDPHTGMIQRWAVRQRKFPHYEWTGTKWTPVRVAAFKSDGKHGHSEMFNPPIVPPGQYGAGTTEVVEKGKATVWVSAHGNLHMLTGSGHAFTFVRASWNKEDDWVLVPMKDSPEGGIPPPHYDRKTEFRTIRTVDEVDKIWVEKNIAYATVKGDGSYRWMEREEDRVQLIGRRPKTRGGRPVLRPDGSTEGINVAHHVPGARDMSKDIFPPGSQAEVEVYVRDRTANKYGGKHFSVVSGRLNSGFGRSADEAAKEGELIIKMWRIHRLGDKEFHDANEMAEELDRLHKESGGVIHTFPRATTPKGAKSLFEKELQKDGEGIILVPKDLSDPMIRLKASAEQQGTITRVVPVKQGVDGSKWFDESGSPLGAGAFEYQTPGGGRGKVGGLTDSMRKDAWENPDKYIGRGIEVTGHKITDAGVVRKPTGFRLEE